MQNRSSSASAFTHNQTSSAKPMTGSLPPTASHHSTSKRQRHPTMKMAAIGLMVVVFLIVTLSSVVTISSIRTGSDKALDNRRRLSRGIAHPEEEKEKREKAYAGGAHKKNDSDPLVPAAASNKNIVKQSELLAADTSLDQPPAEQFRNIISKIVGDMVATAEIKRAMNKRANTNGEEDDPPLVSVLCACGDGVYQTICQEAMLTAANASTAPAKTRFVLANASFRKDDADTIGDKPSPRRQRVVGGDSSSYSPIDFSAPFWGRTADKLKEEIAHHAVKLISNSNSGTPLTLPPTATATARRVGRGSSEGANSMVNNNNNRLSPAAIKQYFNLNNEDEMFSPSSCAMPSFGELLNISNALGYKKQPQDGEEGGGGGKDERGNEEQHDAMIREALSLLRAPSSSSPASVSNARRLQSALKYDYAIVCAHEATVAMKRDDKNKSGGGSDKSNDAAVDDIVNVFNKRDTHYTPAALASAFVKRLLSQSATNYFVVAPPFHDDGDNEKKGDAEHASQATQRLDIEIMNFVNENAFEEKDQKERGEDNAVKRISARRRRGELMASPSIAGPLLSCAAHVLRTTEAGAAEGGGNEQASSPPSSSFPPSALRVECEGVVASSPRRLAQCVSMLSSSALKPSARKETLSLDSNSSPRLPKVCNDIASPNNGFTIDKVIKLGSKTGIYAGTVASLSSSSSEGSSSSSSSSHSSSSLVIVKHFAALQYAQFVGFQRFMASLGAASHPLILTPTDVCYEERSGTVFQLQPFASEAMNLKKFLQHRKKVAASSSGNGNGVTLKMAYKLQIAIQIVCIFDFLHGGLMDASLYDHGHDLNDDDQSNSKHANKRRGGDKSRRRRRAVFSYDDNHFEQYIITQVKDYRTPEWMRGSPPPLRKAADHHNRQDHAAGLTVIDPATGVLRSTSSFYKVQLIDIDTLQQAVEVEGEGEEESADGKDDDPSSPSPSNSSFLSRAVDLKAYRTKCRCFFCKGKSNCMFFNTEEGYAGCGQAADNPASGDNPEMARPPLAAAVGGEEEEDKGNSRKGKGAAAPMASTHRCNPTSDIWFLAQLLYYLGQGGHSAYEGSGMVEVLSRIKGSGFFNNDNTKGGGRHHQERQYHPKFPPTPTTESEAFNALVGRMFTHRPSTKDILNELFALCDEFKCGFVSHQCPPLDHESTPKKGTFSRYRDIVDVENLQV